jgi:hypothetical protein
MRKTETTLQGAVGVSHLLTLLPAFNDSPLPYTSGGTQCGAQPAALSMRSARLQTAGGSFARASAVAALITCHGRVG